MKLKFYYIPLTMLLLCLAFAVIVRFSYTDSGNKIYEYNYVSGGNISDLFKTNQVTSWSDLVAQSDMIVKAKYTGERNITADAFYSNVKVLSIYKGNHTVEGKTICIIEPLAIYTENEFINASGAFWIPLQPGEEYIMLLKHMQFDSERKLDDFQKSQYYPVTKGSFGCYRISAKDQTEPMDDNNMYTINSLKGFDVFAPDRKVLSTYNQYKKQIFKAIGA